MTEREIIAGVAACDPLVPSEYDGTLSCFFCSEEAAERDSERGHSPGCLWVHARRLVPEVLL